MEIETLRHKLLLAMPSIQEDSLFYHALVYVTSVSSLKVCGYMINKPSPQMVNQLTYKSRMAAMPVLDNTCLLIGGPVEPDRLSLLYPDNQEGVLKEVNNFEDLRDISLTQRYLACLGYCQWRSEQLAAELQKNYWVVVKANDTILFDTSHAHRWEVALSQLGVGAVQLIDTSGHA